MIDRVCEVMQRFFIWCRWIIHKVVWKARGAHGYLLLVFRNLEINFAPLKSIIIMNIKTFLTPALIGTLVSFSFTSDKTAAEVYNFDSEVVMEMKEFAGETLKNTSNIKFYASKKHDHLGYVMDITTHGQSMAARIINDAERNTMTTLIDQGGMKMGMQYDLSKMSEMTTADPSRESGSMKKTGRTKTILGHKCHEYEITQDKSYSLAWIAEDMDMTSFYDAFTKMKGAGQNWSGDMPEGFPMEISSWPNGKDTEQKFVIEVKEINKNKTMSISTEGYNIMKLN